MTAQFSHDRYNVLVKATFDKVTELSKLKGGEYSGDNDRLLNFRRNGDRLGLDMEVIWAVYAAKHWDALMQYIQDINTNTSRPRLESLESRCDDLIVYLLLFKAMLQESAETARLVAYDEQSKQTGTTILSASKPDLRSPTAAEIDAGHAIFKAPPHWSEQTVPQKEYGG